MDAIESDTSIFIMTERVRPLSSTLPLWASRKAQEKEDWLLWGLHRISVALTFLNDPCTSSHGRVCTHSIFISPSGEWKLGGFELLSNPKDDAAILYVRPNGLAVQHLILSFARISAAPFRNLIPGLLRK